MTDMASPGVIATLDRAYMAAATFRRVPGGQNPAAYLLKHLNVSPECGAQWAPQAVHSTCPAEAGQ